MPSWLPPAEALADSSSPALPRSPNPGPIPLPSPSNVILYFVFFPHKQWFLLLGAAPLPLPRHFLWICILCSASGTCLFNYALSTAPPSPCSQDYRPDPALPSSHHFSPHFLSPPCFCRYRQPPGFNIHTTHSLYPCPSRKSCLPGPWVCLHWSLKTLHSWNVLIPLVTSHYPRSLKPPALLTAPHVL